MIVLTVSGGIISPTISGLKQRMHQYARTAIASMRGMMTPLELNPSARLECRAGTWYLVPVARPTFQLAFNSAREARAAARALRWRVL